MAFPMGKKTSPTDRLVARTTISKMAYPLIVPPALFSEIRRRFSHVFALFRIYTVYRYSSLSFEVCYDIEILTSNTYLAVILVYLNYLFAAYLLTVL